RPSNRALCTTTSYCRTREVGRLAENKKVQQAFGFIEEQKEQTTADLIALTEILAPPFLEEERGKAFAKLLQQAGGDSMWTDPVRSEEHTSELQSREKLV